MSSSRIAATEVLKGFQKRQNFDAGGSVSQDDQNTTSDQNEVQPAEPAPYLNAPVNIPGAAGLDPSQSPQQFMGQVLDKGMVASSFGMNKSQGDEIEPDYNSPIDFAASAAGNLAGRALAPEFAHIAQSAPEVLNNIGAVGLDIKNTGYIGKGIKVVPESTQPIGNVINDVKQSNPYKPQGYGKVTVKDAPEPKIGKVIRKYADGGGVQSDAQQQAPQQAQPDGVHLWHYGTNQEVVVPHNYVNQAISSRQFSFLNNAGPVPVFDPSGKLGTVPPEYGSQAFQNSYSYATPDAIHEYNLDQQYGDRPLASAALGAANTATFGAANQLLARSGAVSPEALKEIPERNPISHFAGSVAGLGASMLAAPELSPVGLVSKLGQGIAEGAEAALPAATSTAGKILASGLAKGIGGAAEGAFYGSGDVIGEQALGDPNFNADAALAQIGHSALLGGGLGAVVGTGEVAIPEAVSAARDALQKVKTNIWGTAGEGKLGDTVNDAVRSVVAKASGLSREDVNTIANNVPLIDKLGGEVEKVSNGMTKDYQDLVNTLESASKKAVKDIRPAETDELLASSLQGADPDAVQEQFGQVRSWLNEAVDTMRSEPELYSPSYARSLEKFQERFLGRPSQEIAHIGQEGVELGQLTPQEVMPGSPVDAFKQIDELKGLVQDMAKYQTKESLIKPSLQESNSQNLVKKLALNLRQSLEDPQVWGEAGARQASFNSATSDLIGSLRDIKKSFGKQEISEGTPGKTNYKLNAKKFERFLNSKDTDEIASKANVLKNLETSADTYFKELDKSYANVPDTEFDKDHLSDLVQRVKTQRDQGEGLRQINQAVARANIAGDGGQHEMSGMLAVGAHMLGVPSPVVGAAVAANSMKSFLKNPVLTFQRLAKYEALVNKSTQAIAKGSKALFKTGSSALENTQGFIASRATRQDDYDKYQDRIDKLNQLSSNPDALLGKLEDSTQSLYRHAPNNSQALMQATVRGIQFLQSKVPQQAQAGPLDSKPPMNRADVAKFNRYFDAVENPLGLLKQAKAGMITPEAIEAVSTVYPSLLNSMRTEIFSSLTENKKPIPYQLKQQLSIIMGNDLTQSTKPMNILQNQVVLNDAQMQKQAQDAQFVKPTSKALSKINKANQTMTPMQASQSRSQQD